MHIGKKGGFELSVTGIVVLIIAITMLGLGLAFVRGMFGKTSERFYELAAAEPEPPAPTGSNPITLSRPTIKTTRGSLEVVKVGVMNPTDKPWAFRDAVGTDNALCGVDGDGVCYVDTPMGIDGVCKEESDALREDTDCKKTDDWHSDDDQLNGDECADEGGPATDPPQGVCFIHDTYCPAYSGDDPDCAPVQGSTLFVSCSGELDIETETLPKDIAVGESVVFTALLDIRKGIPKKTYLCRVSIVAPGADSIKKDITISVE